MGRGHGCWLKNGDTPPTMCLAPSLRSKNLITYEHILNYIWTQSQVWRPIFWSLSTIQKPIYGFLTLRCKDDVSSSYISGGDVKNGLSSSLTLWHLTWRGMEGRPTSYKGMEGQPSSYKGMEGRPSSYKGMEGRDGGSWVKWDLVAIIICIILPYISSFRLLPWKRNPFQFSISL